MKQYLLIIALLALGVSSLIDSMAITSGAHNIKEEVSCEKCHQDIFIEFKQTIKPYQTHLFKYNDCSGCHSSSSVHAAQIKTCISCHQPDLHIQTYPTCSDCHQPHGGQLSNITHGNGNNCKTCHIIHK